MATYSHSQKSFFKYMSSGTAEKVLESGKLRWSGPHVFNDPFDIQFDMHIEYDNKRILNDVAEEMWRLYQREKEFEPKNRLGYFVKEMSIKQPGIVKSEFQDRVKSGLHQSLAVQKAELPKLHAWAKEQLKTALLLCLTETASNILMWAHYADYHKGAALEFSTLEQSSWGAARQVVYREKMPLLFDHDVLVSFLTGQASIDKDRFLFESTLTKSSDWRYEKEWRVIFHGKKHVDYEYVQFNPAELTGLYLGCRATKDTADRLVKLATKLNPQVAVYKGKKSERSFAVEFATQA